MPISSSKIKHATPKGQSKPRDQVIDGRDIDPIKLADTLDRRFGKENYKVEVC
jgi:hypothetical protein